MKTADGVLFFKEWLPDLPALDNPGLIDARNCKPEDGAYKSFGSLTLLSSATAPSTTALGAHWDYGDRLVIGTSTQLHVLEGGLAGSYTDRSAAATYNAAEYWAFCETVDYRLVAVSLQNRPQRYEQLGAAASFTALATSGEAPYAGCCGIVGQFLVLGRTRQTTASSQEYNVRWSGIADSGNWPTPGSATATAVQSGEQELLPSDGLVVGIADGDQFGLVFQEYAVTRMTYVGGDVVFQFAKLATDGVGLRGVNSFAQVGGLTYFLSSRGFFVTDGVSVSPIGDGKVDRYVLSDISPTTRRVSTGSDGEFVYWSYPTSGQFVPNRVVMYNIAERRWGYGTENHTLLLSRRPAGQPSVTQLTALSTANGISTFTGTPGTAILTSGDAEMHRGGKTFVQGIKPLVDATTNAVTVALGYRDDLQATPTFTAETTANSRSGFADFRNEARYHRARVTITGTFNSAQGIEFQAVPTGAL